jgi:hypothetical protein
LVGTQLDQKQGGLISKKINELQEANQILFY